MIRLFRVALPFIRLMRLALILLRFSDRLVRRMAGLLNRNIILFEPMQAQKAESSDRHRLLTLRSELEQAKTAIEPRLDRDRAGSWPPGSWGPGLPARVACRHRWSRKRSRMVHGREIPVEAVVERLIQMTPERLLDRMGPAFVTSVDRYLRLLDLPLIRRLPGFRNLVAYREKSPAESVALAANYLGSPDPAGAQRRLLPRRPARDALAPSLSRPPGHHDRQCHAHARQTTARRSGRSSSSFS